MRQNRDMANKNNAIETFVNADTQMESRIFANNDGNYTVTLCDLDSGETLPTAFKMKDLAVARKKAQKLVAF